MRRYSRRAGGRVAPSAHTRTMWIRLSDDVGTTRLKLPWMDSAVEFSANGTAQVPRKVGERLVEEVEAVEPHTTEEPDESTSDSDEEDN